MGKKDTYYFSHDSNAQDDPKCMLLIDQLGMEGYGIFWAIIERLRQEPSYKLPTLILPVFAKRWNTSSEKVQTVISKYGLFEMNEDYFFSPRLCRSMQEKSEKARKSASYRWGKNELMQSQSECNAIAMRPQSECNAVGMRNDAIKGKESKVKENIEELNPPVEFKKRGKVRSSAPLHSFQESPHFLPKDFKEKLSDWPPAQLRYYYDSLVDYSLQGNKYADWIAAARTWARKDKAAQKGYFAAEPKKTTGGYIGLNDTYN